MEIDAVKTIINVATHGGAGWALFTFSVLVNATLVLIIRKLWVAYSQEQDTQNKASLAALSEVKAALNNVQSSLNAGNILLQTFVSATSRRR